MLEINQSERNIVEMLEKASEALCSLPGGEIYTKRVDDVEIARYNLQQYELHSEGLDKWEKRWMNEAQILREKLAVMRDEIKSELAKPMNFKKKREEKTKKLSQTKKILSQQLTKIREEVKMANSLDIIIN